MFLAALLSSSMYRFIPLLVVLIPHDSIVAFYAQVHWFCMLSVLRVAVFGITNITTMTLWYFNLKSGSLENQDVEFGLRYMYVQDIVKLKVF